MTTIGEKRLYLETNSLKRLLTDNTNANKYLAIKPNEKYCDNRKELT